jgi:hypothetical protein
MIWCIDGAEQGRGPQEERPVLGKHEVNFPTAKNMGAQENKNQAKQRTAQERLEGDSTHGG